MSSIQARFVLLEIAHPAFAQSLNLVATISAVAIDAAIVVVVFRRIPAGLQLAGDRHGWYDLRTRDVAKQDPQGLHEQT